MIISIKIYGVNVQKIFFLDEQLLCFDKRFDTVNKNPFKM